MKIDCFFVQVLVYSINFMLWSVSLIGNNFSFRLKISFFSFFDSLKFSSKLAKLIIPMQSDWYDTIVRVKHDSESIEEAEVAVVS